MHQPVRRALAAAAATASILALAGCGGDDSGEAKDSSSDTSASADAATSDGASEDAGTEDADTDSGGGETITGDEFADVLANALDQATTANISMDLGGSGTGEGQVDYTQDPPAMAVKLTMQAMGGEIEVRQVDGVIYLKGENFGDGWVSIDATDPNSPFGDIGSQIDPTQLFQTFGEAVTEAVHDGDDEVDGETLDKYTATVDTAKLLADMAQPEGATAATETVEQEWWFDDEGRIRQFSMDMGGTPIKLALSDWDEDVSVEAPPADEVTPFGQGGA